MPDGDAQAPRWVTVVASGVALSRPGRLYCARLAGTGAVSARLHDGAVVGDPLILALATPGAGADDWPKVPVSLPFSKGLYVELTGAGVVTLGWEPG